MSPFKYTQPYGRLQRKAETCLTLSDGEHSAIGLSTHCLLTVRVARFGECSGGGRDPEVGSQQTRTGRHPWGEGECGDPTVPQLFRLKL